MLGHELSLPISTIIEKLYMFVNFFVCVQNLVSRYF